MSNEIRFVVEHGVPRASYCERAVATSIRVGNRCWVEAQVRAVIVGIVERPCNLHDEQCMSRKRIRFGIDRPLRDINTIFCAATVVVRSPTSEIIPSGYQRKPNLHALLIGLP